jgi:hypothetical protein
MTDIPNQWLLKSDTPAEFEQVELRRKAAAFNHPLEKVVEKFHDRPFGEMTSSWRNFVRQLESGDELWSFRSPARTFAEKCGRAGFAIVRDGSVRATLVMVMN